MGKQLLAAALLPLVLLAVGNTQTAGPSGPAALQKVEVLRDGDSLRVEITGSGQWAPKLMTLESPPRVVVLLPDTVVSTSYSHVDVNSRHVKAVRIGTDGRTPPTTSVVIDCLETCKYELVPGSGGKVILMFAGDASSATVAAVAPRKEAPTPAPLNAPSYAPTPAPIPEKQPENTSAALASPAMEAPPMATARYPQKTVAGGKYNGPGGCAASSCHGSVQPKTNTRIFQNEYTIWIAQDKPHTRAFSVLQNNVSERIGKILNIGPPSKAPRCLVCHSLYVPPEQQAQSFELAEGVSCENCHGPASGWLGPHTTKDWPHEKSVQLGMYDTRNLELRSEKCLTCHLGTAEKFVDHEMIAAGHPDLTFELGLFTFVMPPHWKMPEQDNPWRQVQAWGVGQAVQLRESLNRLARRANGPVWPEYAELDCFACHHSLTRPDDSWRQKRGYAGRTPGVPPWNESRVAVFRDLVQEISPNTGKQLDDEVSHLASLMNQLNGKREQIAASATRAFALADQLVKQVDAQGYDSAMTLRLMRRVAGDGADISIEGERSAEQAAMTLDSLFRAYDQNVKPANGAELRAAITGLFAQVQDPSAYSAPRFAAQMQRVSEIVGR
jgi:Cytochrome c554 and c-prime/AMIN domain